MHSPFLLSPSLYNRTRGSHLSQNNITEKEEHRAFNRVISVNQGFVICLRKLEMLMEKKMQILLGLLMVLTVSFVSPARGLVPYRGPYGDLWEAMVDPLKVLDQLPQFISRGLDDLTLARTNWKETPEAHVFTLDVPGMKKEEIKIQVEENMVITISGQRVKEEEKESDKWHRVERGVGKFWRQFRLPGNVDMDSIKASLDNGVLTVTVPKLSENKDKTKRVVDIVETADKKAVA